MIVISKNPLMWTGIVTKLLLLKIVNNSSTINITTAINNIFHGNIMRAGASVLNNLAKRQTTIMTNARL